MSKGILKICPVLVDPASLSEDGVSAELHRPIMINLFEKKCAKKDATISNEWRERLFVFLFNMPDDYVLLKSDTNENYLMWKHYYDEIVKVKIDMHAYEEIDPSKIVSEILVQRAGMSHNYDFDYIVHLEDGTEKIYKYEYKNHRPECLPQILSLYDTANIPTGEAIAKDDKKYGKKYSGKYRTKYNCSRAVPIEDKFQFWRNRPFWLWHFNDEENGIPAIRRELRTMGITLPIITEEDYFCNVKRLKIPGRSIESPSLRADNIEDMEILTGVNSEKKAKHLSDMKIWHKNGLKKYPDDPYKILKFFHILFDNKHNVLNIRNGQSILNYLEAFSKDETTPANVIFKEIYKRQNGKRFIFYYPGAAEWRIGTYNDSFEAATDSPSGEEQKQSSSSSSSAITHDGTNIYLNTKDGNKIEFNLRWANGLGLQNTAWQMNIKEEYLGKSKKKSEPNIKLRRKLPDIFSQIRLPPTKKFMCDLLQGGGKQIKHLYKMRKNLTKKSTKKSTKKK